MTPSAVDVRASVGFRDSGVTNELCSSLSWRRPQAGKPGLPAVGDEPTREKDDPWQAMLLTRMPTISVRTTFTGPIPEAPLSEVLTTPTRESVDDYRPQLIKE